MRPLLAILFLAMSRAPVFADGEPGTTSAPILQIPMGSRALGMGSAFTAVADDPSALYYNPAGLARLDHHEVSLAFFSGQSDNDQQYAAYGGPVRFTGISGNGYASFGGSLLNARNGTIELNELAADGAVTNSNKVSAGSDLVISLGYAERVGVMPLIWGPEEFEFNHFIGIAGKFLYSSLVERYSATTFAGDIGYLVSEPKRGYALGISAVNLGSGLRFIDTADPLPMTFRLGLAYDGYQTGPHKLLLATDADFLLHQRQWHSNIGLEYTWGEAYKVRLGHQFKQETQGITAGFGIRPRRSISFDYAWALGSGLSDLHRLTFSYSFGGVTRARRAQQRRPFIESMPGRRELPDLNEEKPRVETPAPRPRPRATPPSGVPGWIY